MRKTLVLVMFAVIGLGLTAAGSAASPAPADQGTCGVLTADTSSCSYTVNCSPTCSRSVSDGRDRQPGV